MSEGIARLVQWAEANGCFCSPLVQFEYAPHRGVYAVSKEAHRFDAPQLKVPVSLIIHGGVAKKYFGKELAVSETNLNGTLKLLWAKLKFGDSTVVDGRDLNEFYDAYIALLPEGKDTGSPFYWDLSELRLLEGTNLGGSLPAKFDWIVDEWFNSVSDLPSQFHTPQLQADLEFHKAYNSFTRPQLLTQLTEVTSWTSFGAYLWSTTIFTSRAFPHRIIDPSAKDGQAMFVPLIDLLNHNNSTLIEWKFDQSDDGYFTMHNLDDIPQGGEIFNNYGAKGNEELLMGYGFVLEDNQNDSVALKVRPPLSSVLEAREMGVHIPRIDDYTYHAFATDEPQAEELTEETYTGLLYFLNRKCLLPENLVQLFMSLMRTNTEDGFTVRQKLDALQNLRRALEVKYHALKKVVDVPEGIDEHVVRTAMIYRKGQMDVLKGTLAEIKSVEKEILHEYRSHVLSLKKVYKKDEAFRNGLKLFGLETYDDVEEEEEDDDQETFFALWVLLHCEINADGDYTPPEWIQECYEAIKAIPIESDEIVVPRRMEQLKQGLASHPLGRVLTPENFTVATRVIQSNSYTRGSAWEIILVEPLDL